MAPASPTPSPRGSPPFAQANGYTSASSLIPATENDASFSGGVSVGGLTLALNSTLAANGASLVKVGDGSLILSSPNTYAGAITLVSGNNAFGTVLSLGGLVAGTGTTTPTGSSITVNDPNDSGATLTLNYSGATTINNGTLNLSGTGTTAGLSQVAAVAGRRGDVTHSCLPLRRFAH